jgi:hypothetical protein
MRFKVLPRGLKGDDARWTLDVGDDHLVVTDAAGETLADWSGAEAVERVKTPSFWENRKGYGVVIDGQLIDFDARADVPAELQALLDRAHVRKDPRAGKSAIVFGLLTAGGGFALAAAALAVTVVTNQEDGEGGIFWWGGILVGGILLVQGLYRATGAGKWRRLAAELRERDERRRAERAGEWDYREDDTEDDR